ncbi:hypothetical protein [Halorubrum sodomense]|uniref:DUF8125 domain-containing protein n=1 Tax=Halorubrum sodomense TaxID=35743 RepID=A0A1I6FKB1_HALSD|nr:hypothetical protein [Halorubrum sodomense]SFR30375.1 hypothetical protein SAMN04487937_0195 [Halorubrum sodomense]
MNPVAAARERPILAGGLVLLFIAGAESGRYPYPWDVDGAGVVATAAVAIAIGGYVAGGYVADLLPEEEGIYLVGFDASDDTGGSIWELSEDQFEDMDVHAGSLFEWPVAKRVYEVREYRPEDNVAVANWRESVAGSELAGDVQVVDAMEAIAELREEFEPDAREARRLKRRLRSIARTLDKRRLKDQEAILDPTLTPSFDDDSATVSAVLDEELPDDLKPQSMKGDDIDTERNGHGDTIGFELLDETEALEVDDER